MLWKDVQWKLYLCFWSIDQRQNVPTTDTLCQISPTILNMEYGENDWVEGTLLKRLRKLIEQMPAKGVVLKRFNWEIKH